MNDSSRPADLFRRILRQTSSTMPPASPSSVFLVPTKNLSRGQGEPRRETISDEKSLISQPHVRVSVGCPRIIRARPVGEPPFAVDRRDFCEPECPDRLERGLRVVAHLPRNDQNDVLYAGDPGSRTPSQRRIPIIGQVLVKADCSRLAPTKAVKRKNAGWTNHPRATESRTKVPAMARSHSFRVMRSSFLVRVKGSVRSPRRTSSP